MQTAYQKQHTTQLDKILAALPKSAEPVLKRFAAQCYAKTPMPDLQGLDPQYAAAMAASALVFARQRDGSQPKIRIFTPNKKEHGYDSRYPVVELLNDDMPFLVDSLTAELTRHGFSIRETIHPILHIRRDKKGQLQDVANASDKDAKPESLIHFEISPLPEGLTPAQLKSDLELVLQHIRAAVGDWRAITAKAGERIQKLEKARSHFDAAEIAEVGDFLRWLTDRNFIFMGYAEYDFFDTKGKEKLEAVAGSKLGILKISDEASPQGLEALPPELRHFLLVRQLIEITKSNRRSMVHRAVPMDYIGLKRFDAKGKVIGEARFIGLFTSNVYYQSAEEIPLVRRKIAAVLTRSDLSPSSHDGKALKAILEFLPRDEIFQMAADDLFESSMGILSLEAKPGVRVFTRRDAFERFVSCMIFVPRERFSTELRRQIQSIIEKALGGTTSTFSTQITEAPLARLHLTVKTTPGEIPEVDMAKIESDIARSAYLWSEQLSGALLARHDEQKAEKLQRLYGVAFPQSYINRYDTGSAVHDIGKIEEALEAGGLALELFHSKADKDGFFHLKIYNPNEEIALSDILPMLENAGFRAIEEHPFPVMPQGGPQVWIRDFTLQAPGDIPQDFDAVKPLIEETLRKVWRREVENDRFNTLVLKAGLNWRQAAMLRAYAKYLRQTGFAQSQAAIEQTMIRQPHIAGQLAALFIARFDPAVKNRESRQQLLHDAIEERLSQVTTLIDDRILRRYAELIRATLRTNYFRTAPSPAQRGRAGEGDMQQANTSQRPLP